ncbi:hypothetical protein JKF63_04144 [Porcisia hertigi]|uniref:RING-type domain-containing protein n=1 Tax=Porcisia hertigi TaxID=2761500 RepID=A0A836L808_9TRYP|nr:hypothetical protein JKF63_04144 [Porcisia hertigi]
MLLHEALVHTECPICLQPLGCHLRAPPSRPVSPLCVTPSAAATAHGDATSSTSTPGSSSYLLAGSSGSNTSGGLGEFRITFAPGVYGSDATDPWHPSLPLQLPASPREAPGSSHPHSFVHGGERVPFSEGDGHLPGTGGTTAGGDGDEGSAGVVVLPCGHLLHYLCAIQMCEYVTNPSCPVCRLTLTSTFDLILFRPRMRSSSIVEARATAGDSSTRAYVDKGGRTSVTATRKHCRSEEVGGEDSQTPIVEDDLVNSNDANKVQVHSSGPALGRGSLATWGIAYTSTSHSAGERNAVTLTLCDGLETTALCTVPKVQASAAKSPQMNGDDVNTSQGEDDITIVGTRQLPPSQAYTELLLRTSTSWIGRTETLRTRVEHLERSQQQLQNDCVELKRTLTVARRRREVLLDLPSSKDEQDALRSAQRLHELRRLCLETRTAMRATTAQLAEAIRDHAEVRRQTEKYMRKLSRMGVGKECERAGNSSAAASSEPLRMDMPPPPSFFFFAHAHSLLSLTRKKARKTCVGCNCTAALLCDCVSEEEEEGWWWWWWCVWSFSTAAKCAHTRTFKDPKEDHVTWSLQERKKYLDSMSSEDCPPPPPPPPPPLPLPSIQRVLFTFSDSPGQSFDLLWEIPPYFFFLFFWSLPFGVITAITPRSNEDWSTETGTWYYRKGMRREGWLCPPPTHTHTHIDAHFVVAHSLSPSLPLFLLSCMNYSRTLEHTHSLRFYRYPTALRCVCFCLIS